MSKYKPTETSQKCQVEQKKTVSIEFINFIEVFFNFRILYFSNTEVSRFKMFDRIPFRRTLKRPQVMVPPFFGRRFRSEPETVGPSHQGFDNPIYGNTPIDVSIVFLFLIQIYIFDKILMNSILMYFMLLLLQKCSFLKQCYLQVNVFKLCVIHKSRQKILIDNPYNLNRLKFQNEKPMDLELMPQPLESQQQPTFDTSGFDNPLYDTYVQVCNI